MLLIAAFAIYLAFFFPESTAHNTEQNTKTSPQVKKLWSIAQTSMRERKPLRAEKALLSILKIDERNAAAYNRLGILYAKSQKYNEAIECFEIAQSLDSNPSSLHNTGLIYLETGAFEKAAMAFRQALELEGGLPARYLALAKAEEKLGHRKQAIEALESAYELDRNVATLRQILAIHETAGDTEAMNTVTARIESQLVENAKAAEATKEKSVKKARSAKLKTTTRTTRNRILPRPSATRASTKVSASSMRPRPTLKKTTKLASASHKLPKPANKLSAKPTKRRRVI